jgi:DNA polymerase-3 subunit gamma/tau
MKQALYRNYRPRSFKELIGQEHVTATLQRALESGRISHAYLFTGPRGVGKTSAARILAHAANGLKYEDETTHLDIIEIDAASNRRIDEIRDLREKVAVAPAVGKYKVYIIDEVHMLTREAFNALLKTLEEPPAHTIFILATTESHKLPETIISRTQRFEFKPLPKDQMVKHLQKIAKKEGVDISAEALELLAEFGTGSFRDSIGYLDQLSAGGNKITADDVRHILGLPPDNIVKDIIDQVSSGDAGSIISSLDSLKETGVDAAAAAAAIARHIRKALVNKGTKRPLMELLKQLIDVPSSARPYDYLEICLLEAASESTDKQVAETPAKQAPEPKSRQAVITTQKIAKPAPQPDKIIPFDVSLWPKVVDGSKEKAASLYTALRLAEPLYTDGKLILRFQFPLHKKKLDLAKNKDIVAALINELTGNDVTIECVVDKSAFKNRPEKVIKPAAEEKQGSDHINSIANIFGQAEVVET